MKSMKLKLVTYILELLAIVWESWKGFGQIWLELLGMSDNDNNKTK